MDRLSAADLNMVWPEDFGWPQDIGAIAILDGSGLVDSDGRFRIEEVRDHIGSRLQLLPRFRQCLYMPRRGLGWPLWVDAQSFDLADHVGVMPLGPDADEVEFLAACERLRRRPLDRTRPLWELWFLPGLAEGRTGLFMKLHHAMADGVAGVAAFAALLDFTADALPPTSPRWTPAPIPSEGELFRDNLSRRVQAGRALLSRLAHPGDTLREIQRDWPAVGEAFGEGPAPATSVNRRIGSGRRLAVIRSRLDIVKGIAHTQGGKVNDPVPGRDAAKVDSARLAPERSPSPVYGAGLLNGVTAPLTCIFCHSRARRAAWVLPRHWRLSDPTPRFPLAANPQVVGRGICGRSSVPPRSGRSTYAGRGP